jgi:hypothetical protein
MRASGTEDLIPDADDRPRVAHTTLKDLTLITHPYRLASIRYARTTNL